MAKKKGAKSGRAKQKQRAERSANGAAPYSNQTQHRSFGISDDDEDDEVPRTMFRGFDGATHRHTTRINPLLKLRHQSIAFVRGGALTPSEPNVNFELKEGDRIEIDRPEMPGFDAEPTGSTPVDDNFMTDTLDVVCQISKFEGSGEIQALPFVVDTVGDSSYAPSSVAPPRPIPVRTSSPNQSDEEIIVFRGRKKIANIEDSVRQSDTPSLKLATQSNPQKTPASRPATNLSKANSSTYTCGTTDKWTPAPPGAWWRKDEDSKEAKPKAVAQPSAELVDATREAAEATVAVLQTAWAQAKRTEERAKRDRGAQRASEQFRTHQKLSKREHRERKRKEELLRELKDLDIEGSDLEEAAYRDYVENIRAQNAEVVTDAAEVKADLDEATRDGYVEFPQAQSEEVDRMATDLQTQLEESARDTTGWEDTDASGDESDEGVGEDFDEVYGKLMDVDLSDDESSGLEQEIEEAEREIELAKDQLHDLRLKSMTDEQLARLWAKQAELGIDAEELLIDDGEIAYIEEDAGFGDVGAARAGLPEYIALSRNKRGDRRNRRRNQDISFPDASALADAVEQYGSNGFDIMDLDRPSLRPTKNGRKGKMPAELEALSDEELRDSMLNAWDNDRARKRVKKAEREELRTQGMLGSLDKKGKADLDQKYKQGMTLVEIQVELEIFLQDEGQTTRSFPPMEKADRKALHDIANVLGLKSKSVGIGLSRAPVLYKTKSTQLYNEATIHRAMGIVNRRFLKNQNFKGKVAKHGATPFKRSGGTGGTGIRHGELVGAGAKEIGKENFGSKLMEKMGWTRGTALGKDGEGVLHPVEQVMRIGKAGLG